jgi:hypothetical protein
MWCIQTMDFGFRERMYDILDLYEEPYDLKRPLIALDEKPKQLLKDSRKAISMKPGSPEKYDYEYIRNGTATIFMAVEFKAGKRLTQVTRRRTKQDFASFVKRLIDTEYSQADVLRLVVDNLNILF